MWVEKDALVQVKSYFRKDECCLFVQRLPRFYPASKGALLFLCMLAALCLFLYRPSVGRAAFPAFLLADVLLLYDFGMHMLFRSAIVVSQYSVYRCRRLPAARIDEWKWSDVREVSVRVWRLAPAFATVSLRKKTLPFQPAAPIRSFLIRRNLYKSPEALDFRELSLNRPHALRAVVRRHDELCRILQALQQTEGFVYSVPKRKQGNGE